MANKSRLQRLEKHLEDNIADRREERAQRQYMDDTREAIALYLKAETVEEEAEAVEVLERMDGQLKHEYAKDFFSKYSNGELRKLTTWKDTKTKGEN